MLVGLMGKAEPIPADRWAEHQKWMWDEFDSPEAQARERARIDEITEHNRDA